MFHKMPKSLSRQVRHIMSPWSLYFEHVSLMPPFTVTSLSYNPLLPGNTAGRRVTPVFHKMPKSLSRQVRHIMSPWSLYFEHVSLMPPFTVTSLSYNPLLPGNTAGRRVTPVFHKMPKSLSRQVRHIMSPWSMYFEHVSLMPPFTVTSLSYNPLLPGNTAGRRVTPVFHKMPKSLSRQVRHIMSPWSMYFEHVSLMPPFTVTSLSYNPLLPGNTAGRRVTPVFHKMPKSLSRQVRHIMSPWSLYFEHVSLMPPFTVTSLSYNPLLPGNTAGRRVTPVFHKMPKSLSRQVRHIMSPWSMYFEHVSLMPPFTVTSLSYNPLLPGNTAGRRVTPVFHKMPKSLSRQVRHIMSPWSMYFEHVSLMPPFTVTSLSYNPLLPGNTAGRRVTPVFHKMPKSLSRQVRHIMSPWSMYFEHVSLMPPFTVTSLSYNPLLPGNTAGRRVTPVFNKMPKSLSRQVIHIMSPWSLYFEHVSLMPPFTVTSLSYNPLLPGNTAGRRVTPVFHKMPKSLSRQVRHIMSPWSMYFEHVSLMPPFTVTSLSYNPLLPGNTAGRRVTPVFHKMPKSLSRQVRHIMSPWSMYFEHVSLMPPFTVTSLSYNPLLPGNTAGRRVTPVFHKMPKSLSRQVRHIMSPWSMYFEHVSLMPPFTVTSLSYNPLLPGNTAGRRVTPVFHKMPKSLSRQVRHIMSPWSMYFEHVSLMPPFTVTSLSYNPLLPGNTAGRRVTPVFNKMPKSLSRQVIHIMSPWSLYFEHVSLMPPFTVTSLSYNPLLPGNTAGRRVTPVFHKMPKSLSRQVRHIMSPWSLYFEHVSLMPPFNVTSLSYNPLLPGNTAGRRVTPVFNTMPKSLSRQVIHIMSPWSLFVEHVSPMPPFTRDKSMTGHGPIDKAILNVLKSRVLIRLCSIKQAWMITRTWAG